jgi:hypothetical protein
MMMTRADRTFWILLMIGVVLTATSLVLAGWLGLVVVGLGLVFTICAVIHELRQARRLRDE